MKTTTQNGTVTAPALAMARFAGYSLGAEFSSRVRASAQPTQILRVFDQACRHGKVARGTLTSFIAGWRMAEAQ